MVTPQSPPRPVREYKHLAIHLLVEQSLLVFQNIADKRSIDAIVGLPEDGELRTAGIRIKTSSLNINNQTGKKYWAFKDILPEDLIEKTPFFYIFCCQKESDDLGKELIHEPWFIVISSAGLKQLSKVGSDGKYNFSIPKEHLKLEWEPYVSNFKQIKDFLHNNSQASVISQN
jgi:hypothetical protein